MKFFSNMINNPEGQDRNNGRLQVLPQKNLDQIRKQVGTGMLQIVTRTIEEANPESGAKNCPDGYRSIMILMKIICGQRMSRPGPIHCFMMVAGIT